MVRIVAQLRAVWPEVRLTLRADSGFCREPLPAWCETHGVDYIIGLARNERLTTLIAPELATVEREYAATGTSARVFAELTYQKRES